MPIEAVLFDLFNPLSMVRDGDAFYRPALKQLHKTLIKNNINIPFDAFRHEYFQVRDELYKEAETNLEELYFNMRIRQTLRNFNIHLPPEHPAITKATNTFCKEFTKHTNLDPDAETILPKLSEKYELGMVSNFHP